MRSQVIIEAVVFEAKKAILDESKIGEDNPHLVYYIKVEDLATMITTTTNTINTTTTTAYDQNYAGGIKCKYKGGEYDFDSMYEVACIYSK